jgi:hypothetical protein
MQRLCTAVGLRMIRGLRRWPRPPRANAARPCRVRPQPTPRRGGRVVECAGLEIRYTPPAYRGFESLPLRHLRWLRCRSGPRAERSGVRRRANLRFAAAPAHPSPPSSMASLSVLPQRLQALRRSEPREPAVRLRGPSPLSAIFDGFDAGPATAPASDVVFRAARRCGSPVPARARFRRRRQDGELAFEGGRRWPIAARRRPAESVRGGAGAARTCLRPLRSAARVPGSAAGQGRTRPR